jgi:hypothetical protein
MSQHVDNSNVDPYAPPEARDLVIGAPAAFEPPLLASRGSRLGAHMIDGSLPFGVALLVCLVGRIGTLMIFGDDQRCLHDRIASTNVILASSSD